MAVEYDLALVGGGLVGASLAVALQPLAAKLNWRICILESQPPQLEPSIQDWQPSFDGRNTALSWGTSQIYSQLGLWQALQQHAYPIEHIHISDKGYLGSSQLHASEQQVAALGYVVPNLWLGKVLWQAVRAASCVEVIAPVNITSIHFPQPDYALLQGQRLASSAVTNTEIPAQKIAIRARLVILADGGRSGLKQQLGIADQQQDYAQSAIITNVRLSKPHQGWAYERFASSGPMALLPLAGSDMALIWTRSSTQASIDANLTAADFLHALQTSFGNQAGRFVQVGERFIYPLRKTLAQEQVRRNLVLLGNSAHYLHPVAGQGYNLAMRGVTSLVAALTQAADKAATAGINYHPGDLEVLQVWQQQRQQDQTEVIGFSHGLIQLFGQQSAWLGKARAAGLLAFNQLRPVKSWLTRKAMGG